MTNALGDAMTDVLATPGRQRQPCHLVVKKITGFVLAAAVWMSSPGLVEAMSMAGKPGYKPTSMPFRIKRPRRMPVITAADEERLSYEGNLKECEDGAWSRALELLNIMGSRGIRRTRHAWASATAACARAGRWEEAAGLLQAMGVANVPPDHIAYSNAIEACEEHGAYQHAARLLIEMKQRGLPPNLDAYAKVLRLLVQGGRPQEAAALYQEANNQGLFSVWTNRARFLDLQELSAEVAEVVVRFAVEERAKAMVGGKAGRGGFYVLTGPANKKTAFKQQAVLRVMREEFGLKVRVDPAKFGRMQVRGTELQRVGNERLMASAHSRHAHAR